MLYESILSGMRNIVSTAFVRACMRILMMVGHWNTDFVLSAALDAGTSIQALVVYIFGIGSIFAWWGNSAVSEFCYWEALS